MTTTMTMTHYETVIGLEVHAQLATKTKLFCGCPTQYGAAPNTQVCPVCLALPGALPVPNRRVIDLAICAGLALDCDIALSSCFARKNYFYPDLPKGYQISQFALPINGRGHLDIEVPVPVSATTTASSQDASTYAKRVGITRIHIEEDAAKNIHGKGAGANTLVDFNRGGTPLIEIVSEPDMRSAEEAVAYLRKLRDILMFIGVNDGNLEEGSFRCDANVSIRLMGETKLGTRTELKNINSFKFVQQAITYEVARQQRVLERGGSITQETRTWSEPQQKTLSMRSKEEAHDYRYFPDPDLLPITLTQAHLDAIQKDQPKLPEVLRTQWQQTLGLTAYDAGVLTGHPKIAAYFGVVIDVLAQDTEHVKDSKDLARVGKKAANFIQSEVLRYVTTEGLDATFPVEPEQLAALLTLVEKDTINGKIAKKVFAAMVETGDSPEHIVSSQGLAQVTDTAAIETQVREVICANPKQVAQYKAGKTNVLGFFVGQVMKATRGAANPKMVNELLRKILGA